MGTAATITSNSATYVNAGSCIFTAPNIPGYYNICFHARFKGGGNSNDVTIQAGGQHMQQLLGMLIREIGDQPESALLLYLQTAKQFMQLEDMEVVVTALKKLDGDMEYSLFI